MKSEDNTKAVYPRGIKLQGTPPTSTGGSTYWRVESLADEVRIRKLHVEGLEKAAREDAEMWGAISTRMEALRDD